MGFNTVNSCYVRAFELMTEKEKQKMGRVLVWRSKRFYPTLVGPAEIEIV